MDFGEIETRGLVLLGCGKMGGAMLEGWLAQYESRDGTVITEWDALAERRDPTGVYAERPTRLPKPAAEESFQASLGIS